MHRPTLGLTFIFSLALTGCQKDDGIAPPATADAGDSQPASGDPASDDMGSGEGASGDTASTAPHRSSGADTVNPKTSTPESDGSNHGPVASHRDAAAASHSWQDAGKDERSVTEDSPDASQETAGPGPEPTDGTDPGPNPTDGSSETPDTPLLFVAHCASCHGEDGRGKPGEAPEIQHPVVDQAAWIVRHGRSHDSYATEMPAFDEHLVSNEQLTQILAYLESFPVPTTGKALFLDYCANCHGADAAGGTTGQRLTSDSSQFTAAVRQGYDRENLGSRSTYMPRWSAAQLSDQQIEAIAEYVTTIAD